jgi:alkylated DNA repair dioxygenase AlkB
MTADSLSHCTFLIKSWLPNHQEIGELITDEVKKLMRCQLTWSKGWPARATQDHKMCRMGDRGVTYSHKGKSKPIHPWTKTVLSVAAHVASKVDNDLSWMPNCCVVNTYGPGGDLHPHRDSEYIPQLGDRPTIASVSFGVARTFLLYPLDENGKRTKFAHEILLEPGDLFVMHGECDEKYHHAIKPELVEGVRLSLTFRKHLDV